MRSPARGGRWLAAGFVAVALLAVGCGGDADDADPDATSEATPADRDATTSAPPSNGPATSAPPAGEGVTVAPGPPGGWEQAAITVEPVAEVPTAIALSARAGTSDLYVASRDGRGWRLARPGGGSWAEPELVFDLRGEVTTDNERGLLGLAFSPDGSTLYLSRTDPDGRSIVEAVAMVGTSPDPATRRVLLTVDQPYGNHNGGHLAVDADGLLYLGLGDGGGAGDPLGAGQDRTQLLGSMVRIDPAPQPDAPYRIPPDNPFADGVDGAPEVWSYGLRNPWRFSFDRATGDLWVADVGQDRWEEINVLRADAGRGRGANLGWNRMEGLEPYQGGTEPPDHHRPVFVYPTRSEGRCSIIGGFVYRGAQIPELAGAYVYGDLCSGEVRGLAVTADEVVDAALPVSAEGGALVSFGEDGDGELYLLELTGQVSRLVPAPG